MYLIALKMLFGDKSKYISMIVGISFSTLIMTQQPSILVGLLSRTYSFIRDVSLACTVINYISTKLDWDKYIY